MSDERDFSVERSNFTANHSTHTGPYDALVTMMDNVKVAKAFAFAKV